MQRQIWYEICKFKGHLKIDTGIEGEEANMSIIVTPQQVLMLDHQDRITHILGHENQILNYAHYFFPTDLSAKSVRISYTTEQIEKINDLI